MQCTDRWQEVLKQAVTNPKELCDYLGLDLPTYHSPFRFKAPWPFIQRMTHNNPNDPLFLQVMNQLQESHTEPGFNQDPLGETHINPTPGVLHKYHGRALITLAGGCAIHCRYCFRRHFDYQKNQTNLSLHSPAYTYLATHSSIEEVILSGGDPLLHQDQKLLDIISHLADIPHLKRIRIHSRLPIVIPQRITARLLSALTSSRLQPILVIHCNHAQELDQHTQQAFSALQQNNITILNQAVLLRGINDDGPTLVSLSEALFSQGVLPYYLHTLDPVAGAAHFDVRPQRIKQCYEYLLSHCPGYLVPKLVTDGPGKAYKTPWQSP